MRVALLREPKEQRQYHIGDGEMNRKIENLMCFSREVVWGQNPQTGRPMELQGPDNKAKVPQAVKCFSCPNASWDKYRQNPSKDNIPPCDMYIYATLIDTEFKLPLQLYVRSKSKAPFEKGMEQLTRTLLTKFSQDNIPPNYYDVSFTLGTKAIQSNGKTSYILDLSDFQVVTPDERDSFGEVFKNLVGAGDQEQEQLVADTTAVAAAQNSVDSLVTGYDDSEPITI